MKKVIYRLIGLAILGTLGWGGYRLYKQLPERLDTIPTTKVQRSDVVIRAFTRGELRAVRSVTLFAPNLNGTVQVTALAPVGSLAREKDLIVEYDDSERLAALEEARLGVQSVDEQIKKAKADLGIQQSQDAVTLLKTRYDVRRAELDVQRNPIIDAIDAKKNILMLEQSKRALTQLEADIQARKDQADSQLAVYQQQRNANMINVNRELQRIAQTKALAQITGLVAVRQNRAGFFSFGQQMPDIREGDTLQPGMPVADLLDLSELEVLTKVGELDRANLKEGQDALLQLDAIPDQQFRGKIKAMSGTATSDVFSGDPSKKFDVIFSIDMRQLLTGLGMKPVDVDRVMATAESNAKKNLVNTASSFFASLQGGVPGAQGGVPGVAGGIPGMPGAGQPGMAGMPGQTAGQDNQDQADQGGQGGGRGRRGSGGGQGRGQGGDQTGGGGQGRGGGGDQASGGGPGRGSGGDQAAGGGQGRGGGAPGGQGRGMANLSEEDRQKMQQLRQQAQSASDADRPKIVQQIQDLMAKAGVGRGGASGAGGRGDGGGRAPGGDAAGAGGGRQGGGPGGGAGAGFMGGGNPANMMRAGGGGGGSMYTEEERNNAKLPIPPEQDSQLQALLRPGLLADVEIVVEKIPDVLHVPTQAVFQRNGKPTVFVQQKNGKFEAREVQLQKQSESLMVLASGVRPGEVIALADPTVDKSDKKKSADKKSPPGNPMGGMPGGK
ncbi:MAG: efflux RND transporter periplasmic adaptor subunit [Acidobacteriia bacterium]|nr:efflux RND transporter periplasmic adaptor subunit [Terriglobia bacterium]